MDHPEPHSTPSRSPFAYPEMFANPSPWTLAAVPHRVEWFGPAIAAVLADADLALAAPRFDRDQPTLRSHIESAIALRR